MPSDCKSKIFSLSGMKYHVRSPNRCRRRVSYVFVGKELYCANKFGEFYELTSASAEEIEETIVVAHKAGFIPSQK